MKNPHNKKKNTGYLDGWYGLPAGHIEGEETLFEALQREILEEVGLHLDEKDVKLVHTSHRVEDRVYFDFFFDIVAYSGTPTNGEPEKSEGIYWIDWKKEKPFQSKKILELIESGKTFSEINNKNL